MAAPINNDLSSFMTQTANIITLNRVTTKGAADQTKRGNRFLQHLWKTRKIEDYNTASISKLIASGVIPVYAITSGEKVVPSNATLWGKPTITPSGYGLAYNIDKGVSLSNRGKEAIIDYVMGVKERMEISFANQIANDVWSQSGNRRKIIAMDTWVNTNPAANPFLAGLPTNAVLPNGTFWWRNQTSTATQANSDLIDKISEMINIKTRILGDEKPDAVFVGNNVWREFQRLIQPTYRNVNVSVLERNSTVEVDGVPIELDVGTSLGANLAYVLKFESAGFVTYTKGMVDFDSVKSIDSFSEIMRGFGLMGLFFDTVQNQGVVSFTPTNP